MDDLIFIILTIVVTVIGAIGQINKKKKSNQKKTQTKEEPDNFWDFLNEETKSQEEQPKEELERMEPVTEERLKPEPEPKITKPGYQFTAEKEVQSIYNSEITDKEKKEKRKRKKKIKDFSLRKAVIYSEILNRKYH